jgi:hypothetical protein
MDCQDDTILCACLSPDSVTTHRLASVRGGAGTEGHRREVAGGERFNKMVKTSRPQLVCVPRLPDELMQLIIGCLPTVAIMTVYNLTRTSKHLEKLIWPTLVALVTVVFDEYLCFRFFCRYSQSLEGVLVRGLGGEYKQDSPLRCLFEYWSRVPIDHRCVLALSWHVADNKSLVSTLVHTIHRKAEYQRLCFLPAPKTVNSVYVPVLCAFSDMEVPSDTPLSQVYARNDRGTLCPLDKHPRARIARKMPLDVKKNEISKKLLALIEKKYKKNKMDYMTQQLAKKAVNPRRCRKALLAMHYSLTERERKGLRKPRPTDRFASLVMENQYVLPEQYRYVYTTEGTVDRIDVPECFRYTQDTRRQELTEEQTLESVSRAYALQKNFAHDEEAMTNALQPWRAKPLTIVIDV